MADLLEGFASAPQNYRGIDLEQSRTGDTGALDYQGARHTLGWLDSAMRSAFNTVKFNELEGVDDIAARAYDQSGITAPELEDVPKAFPASNVTVFNTQKEAESSQWWFKDAQFTPGMSEARLQAMFEDKASRRMAEGIVEAHQPGIGSVVGFFSEAVGMADPTWVVPWTKGVLVGELGRAVPTLGKFLGPTLAQGVQFGLDNAISTALTRPIVESAREAIGDQGEGTRFQRVVHETAMAAFFGGVLGGGVFGHLARRAHNQHLAFGKYIEGLDVAWEQFQRGEIINPQHITEQIMGMIEIGGRKRTEDFMPSAMRDFWTSGKIDPTATAMEASKAWVHPNESFPIWKPEPLPADFAQRTDEGFPVWNGQGAGRPSFREIPRQPRPAEAPARPAEAPATPEPTPAAQAQPQGRVEVIKVSQAQNDVTKALELNRRAEEARKAATPKGNAHNRVDEMAKTRSMPHLTEEITPLHQAYSDLLAEHTYEVGGMQEHNVTLDDILEGRMIAKEYYKPIKGPVRAREHYTPEYTGPEIAKHLFGSKDLTSTGRATGDMHITQRARDKMKLDSDNAKRPMSWDQLQAELRDGPYGYLFQDEALNSADFVLKLGDIVNTQKRMAKEIAEREKAFDARVQELKNEYHPDGSRRPPSVVMEDQIHRTANGDRGRMWEDFVMSGHVPRDAQLVEGLKPGEWHFIDGSGKVIEDVAPDARATLVQRLDEIRQWEHDSVMEARWMHDEEGFMRPDPSPPPRDLRAEESLEIHEQSVRQLDEGDWEQGYLDSVEDYYYSQVDELAEGGAHDVDGNPSPEAYRSATSEQTKQAVEQIDALRETVLESLDETVSADVAKQRMSVLDQEMAEAAKREANASKLLESLEDCDI